MRLWNCSRGIRRPQEAPITYEDYIQLATDSHSYLLSETETGFMDGYGSRARVVSQIFAVV